MRWLTERAANVAGPYTGRKNRPVLMHADGRFVTMKEAREDLRATSVILHSFRTRLNACGLEDRLQRAINDYQLGHRLHRHVAKGQHVDGEDNCETNPAFLCHCFIAVIPIQSATLTRETVTTQSGVQLKINLKIDN